MKYCPTCNRGYSDDSLSFCLDDGSPLTPAGAPGPSGYDPQATLIYSPGRPTDPTAPHGVATGGPSQSTGGGWGSQGSATVPAKKRSNAIWWVLGIGGVVVIGGGALLLIIGVIGFATLSSNNTNNRNSTASNQNSRRDPINNVNDDGRSLALTDDFSEEKWSVSSSAIGSSSYVAGMYQLTGIPERYFVMYGPTDDYRTNEQTTVKVTARSVGGESTPRGYGLAVYGHVENGNANDYSFMITSSEDPKFIVLLHRDGVTTTVKELTRATSIRGGNTPNQLELKITPGQMSFYINGQFATSITNDAGFTTGRVGVCVHDPYPVAFDDLQIYRQG